MADLHTGSDTLADELLRAYDEGKSVDELNEMLGAEESQNEEALPFAEDEEENREEENTAPPAETKAEEDEKKPQKPYRVYNSQEAFQRDFDNQFNRRYKKERDAHEAKNREFEGFKAQVAEFLNVSPEKVLEELETRAIRAKAEENGVSVETQIKEHRNAAEIARLRRELDERDRREKTDRAIKDIRAQGEALSKDFPEFNLDEAMEDEGFRSTCFSLYNLSPENAVKKAFLACEGLGKLQKTESTREPRVSEGAARPSVNSAVKKVNVGGMTDKEILDFERKILNGEKVLLE